MVDINRLESSISWLDFAEDDRRKMMEVVSLFKLRETRDELGFGSTRTPFLLHGLQALDGQKILLPSSENQWPSRDALAWKYEKFQRAA